MFAGLSISRSALRRVTASIRVTFCCSGVGSKKSRGIAGGFYHSEIVLPHIALYEFAMDRFFLIGCHRIYVSARLKSQ
jgi:hypothetical protein